MKNSKKPKQQIRKSTHKVSKKTNKSSMTNEKFFELLFGKPTRTISIEDNKVNTPQETIASRFLKDAQNLKFKQIVEKHTSKIKEWRITNNIPTATSSKNKEELTYRNVLSVGTFFSGLGAPEYALSEANIVHTSEYVIEINKYCRETLIKNHNPKLVFEDITSVLPSDLPEVDLICWGSPCQDLSKSNNNGKGLYGEKSKYFFEGYRLLKAQMPKYSIFENVEGLMSSNNGEDLKTVLKLFRELNYEVFHKVINPVDVGGCTTRKRVFFVLIRKDIGIKFNFPKNDKSTKCINDCLITNVEHTYFDKSEFIPWHKPLEEQTRGVLRKDYKWLGSKRDEKTRVYNKYSKCPTIQRDCKVFVNDGIGIRYLLKEELKELQGFKDNLDLTMLPDSQYKSQLGNTMEVETMKKLLLEIERINNLHIQQIKNGLNNSVTKPKRTRKLKPTKIINNHINIDKRIVNNPDLNYLNITQPKLEEYQQHLASDGTISMTTTKYKSKEDKKLNKVENKYIVSIYDLKRLGFRDKKNGIYRVKIISSKIDIIEKVGKTHVLVSRNGGKGGFADIFEYTLNQMDIKQHNTFIDSFAGGGGFTLKNIDKMNFKHYIMNDLDVYVYKTFLAVKKDYDKVSKVFTSINKEFMKLITPELSKIEKEYIKNKCKSLSKTYYERRKIRETTRLKEFFETYIDKLNIDMKEKSFDIYTIAGIYIFIMNRTFNGLFEYWENGDIKRTKFNYHLGEKDKLKMIKHWSFLLNNHNVEIRNENIFDILPSLEDSCSLYLDPPYFNSGKGAFYNSDMSNEFQLKLINETNRFQNVLYSNENCKTFNDLEIKKYFNNYTTFERNNRMGSLDKKKGKEFLGWRTTQNEYTSKEIDISFILQQLEDKKVD